ncbi:ABC transporter permease [Comamonas testosteroni]|uniref:ABC transporter permease n=1 Tax=Comamonas testosteroni TaxID=285 RepID=UPI002DBE6946|nr:ABC transporter permease [Comamonas testosteroni]MEB5967388.1 ABC transporter permease [Comamonas testosteroni]
MFSYIARRAVSGFITLLGVVVVVFFLSRLTGSPIDLYLPEGADAAQIEAFKIAYGLDKTIFEQFAVFVQNMAHGDFGVSIWQQRPAMEAVLSEMPLTLLLAAIAMSISIVIAIILGSLAAVYRFGLIDRLVTFLSLVTSSLPHFWFALVGILIFAVQLRLLPTSGSGSWLSWILPVATVSIGPIGVLTQIVRGAMIDVLSSGYIRNARARGFGGKRIVFRHALRNAALPIISVAGDIAAGMVNGAVIVSVVFAFPGIGRLIVGAILNRDFPVLQASILVIGIAVIVLNLVIDLICTIVDPRIRLN